MLPLSLIFGCIAAGLIAAAAVIALDNKQLSGMMRLVTGKDPLACFQRVYLPGFLSAMLADWLQGPFVYALYESYGIDRKFNGYLFVAGFGASAVFGTFVGSAADRCGRKKFAILYCMIYFGHCLTKHINLFGVLLVGRILGGISTSLLFSVFDSWLVSESQSRGFDGEQLGNTFSLAYFGSSIAAIAAGQFGEVAANLHPLTNLGGPFHFGGYVSPFDLSNVVLVICMVYILKNWSENFGQTSDDASNNFTKALAKIVEDKRVLFCGLIASSFESSMFIFVFNWTPCLMEEGQPAPPFGHIFSAFMIGCLLGTRIFSYLSGVMEIEQICLVIMIISAASHVTILFTTDVTVRFFAFLAFETCVGLYFPIIGTLKGEIVPEDMRSTIYNLYRLPLNVIVLLPLLMDLSISTTFTVTTGILINGAVCSFLLKWLKGDKKYAAVEEPRPNGVEAVELGRADEGSEDSYRPGG